ncbi:autotransporter domain-containing protein, partial [Pelistega europaea]
TGAGVLNLQAKARSYHTLTSQVGVEALARVADKWTINTRVGVGYDLLGKPASARVAFAGAPNVPFTVEGAKHNRVSGQAGLSVNYHANDRATFSVGYDAQFRAGYRNQSVGATLKVAF